MNMRLCIQPHRRWIFSTAVALAALCSTSAWAGELKVGAAPLDVDDKGNITASGRKAAVDTLDEVPGEDVWQANIWAKLDNAAAGPLYLEFYQNLNGTDSLVWRHEEGDFAGGKFFSGEVDLQGGRGFNKDRVYEIKAVQVSAKGKDLTLASGKVKLIKSGKKPEKSADDGEDDEAKENQDAHDSLADDDKSSGDEPKPTPSEAPPEVEPKAKKGCAIDSDSSTWNGALLLLVIGAGIAARRRRTA
jgi:MYXO-CTERM domain-containing protein